MVKWRSGDAAELPSRVAPAKKVTVPSGLGWRTVVEEIEAVNVIERNAKAGFVAAVMVELVGLIRIVWVSGAEVLGEFWESPG